jgi:DNA-binding transcriptional LysR family regulator
MELRHLRYFVAVADELHFGHAAARLYTSQPSLSQQIRNLEKELRVDLFVRSKHRVEMTKAGDRFLKEARLILASADRAAELARQAERSDNLRLVIGISPETSWQFLRPVLREFAEHLPSVDVVFRVIATGAQPEALRGEMIDVGFVSLPVSGEGIESERIERAPLRVALSEAHPLARRRRIALEGLASERFTLWPRDLAPGLRDEIEEIFTRAGFGPPLEMEGGLPSVRTTLGMVAAGLTIALVEPESQLTTPGVVFRELHKPIFIELGVIHRTGDSSAILASFLSLVRETAIRLEGAKPASRSRSPRLAASAGRATGRRRAG